MSTRSRALRGAAVERCRLGRLALPVRVLRVATGVSWAPPGRVKLPWTARWSRPACGEVEYVERGTGEPVLVSHGIFQSSESVLLFGELFPWRRVIAPSRFGYLGSNLPPKANTGRSGRRLRRAARCAGDPRAGRRRHLGQHHLRASAGFAQSWAGEAPGCAVGQPTRQHDRRRPSRVGPDSEQAVSLVGDQDRGPVDHGVPSWGSQATGDDQR